MNPQLKELTEFMEAHHEMRFWQSLFALYGKDYTALGFMDSDNNFKDTYYEEGK